MAHICPVEGTLINEPTVRVVAGLVAITAVIGIYFQSPIIFLFLAFDFFVRGFDIKEWSLFRYFGIKTVTLIDVKEKLIDAGGKKFASKVGFILSSILTVAAFLEVHVVVYALGGILVLFASMEAVLAYCVGCKIYTFYNKVWQT
jgi:hypothetical protein